MIKFPKRKILDFKTARLILSFDACWTHTQAVSNCYILCKVNALKILRERNRKLYEVSKGIHVGLKQS